MGSTRAARRAGSQQQRLDVGYRHLGIEGRYPPPDLPGQALRISDSVPGSADQQDHRRVGGDPLAVLAMKQPVVFLRRWHLLSHPHPGHPGQRGDLLHQPPVVGGADARVPA